MAFKAKGQVTQPVEHAGLTPREAANLYIEAHDSLPDTVEQEGDDPADYFEILGRCEACGLVVMMGDDVVSDPDDGTMRHLVCVSADD